MNIGRIAFLRIVVFGIAIAHASPVSAAYILGPTIPGKWGGGPYGTPGGVVTYSYMATGVSCAAEFAGCTITALDGFMPVGYKASIEAAFSAWSAIANITFTEVADNGAAFNGAGATGDIRIGGHAFDGLGGTDAHTYFPPANGLTAAGDMHFDIDESWSIGVSPGNIDIFLRSLHEIGHAIGLDHTNTGVSIMNAAYNDTLTGLQPDDIAGAQFIYGPNPNSNAVPEPGTIAYLGFGLLALGIAKRKR